MLVFLCEKPAVALKVAMALSKYDKPTIKSYGSEFGYIDCYYKACPVKILYVMGHLCELQMPYQYDLKYKKWNEETYPFLPQTFKIALKENKHVKAQFKLIKQVFLNPKVKEIYNLCDADKEGNAIFKYCYDMTGTNKPTKRIWLQSLTKEGILKALENPLPKEKDELITNAAIARHEADYLVGINMTVLSTLKFKEDKEIINSNSKVISIGRVQTPTLAMLVERERKIENFKSENYYHINAAFKTKDGWSYTGRYIDQDETEIKSIEKAKEIIKDLNNYRDNCYIEKINEFTQTQRSPLLYDYTTLMIDAIKKYKYTGTKFKEIIQSLWEKEAITYPRTTSRFLSEDMFEGVKRALEKTPSVYFSLKEKINKEKLNVNNKLIFNNNKIKSHTAIIPTPIYPNYSTWTVDEVKIYGLIYRRFLQAFMDDCKYIVIDIETKVGGNLLLTTYRKMLESGWRTAEKKITDKRIELENILSKNTNLNFKQSEKVEYVKSVLLEKKTVQPRYFTEADLYNSMEKASNYIKDKTLKEIILENGIGTPATRVEIVNKLIKAGYIYRIKNIIRPTEKGIYIIENLPLEPLKSPQLTAEWEIRLRGIEEGMVNYSAFMDEIKTFTLNCSNTLKGNVIINT